MTDKKSWRQKLNNSKDLPKVQKFTKAKSKSMPAGTYVIPAPVEVDEIMKMVPKGRLITINEIREHLAKKHNAQFGCPITTGIFAWIAANAAEEAAAEGKKRITPYWRTLKTGGELNPKYPGGIDALKKLLQDEGHKIIQKSKRFFVADYQKKLAKIRVFF
ncbi:MAG: MGMT family protein [Sedimentisphaerales bacterium]|nr:MGMT family protein [Sedimentisphaerales bacterium]